MEEFDDYNTWYDDKKAAEKAEIIKWANILGIVVLSGMFLYLFGPDLLDKIKQLVSKKENKKVIVEFKKDYTQQQTPENTVKCDCSIINQLIKKGQTNLLGTLGGNENLILMQSIFDSKIFNSINVINIGDDRGLYMEMFSIAHTNTKIFLTNYGNFEFHKERMKTNMRLKNDANEFITETVDVVGNAISKIQTKGSIKVQAARTQDRKERLNKSQNISKRKKMSKVTEYEDIMTKKEVENCDCVIINKINSFSGKCSNILPDDYERILKPIIDKKQTLIMFCDLNDKGKFYGGEYIGKNTNTAWAQQFVNKNTRIFKNMKFEYSDMPRKIVYKIITDENGKAIIVPSDSDEFIETENENNKEEIEPLMNKFFFDKDEIFIDDLFKYLSDFNYKNRGSILNVLTRKVSKGEIENPDGESKPWVRINILNKNLLKEPPIQMSSTSVLESYEKTVPNLDTDNQEKPETIWIT